MAETSRPAEQGAGTSSAGFTVEERAAMRERAREVDAEARRGNAAAKAAAKLIKKAAT